MNFEKLKTIDEKFEVYKDGEFKTCGFLHQKKIGLMSFIGSKKYIGSLKNNFISAIICSPDLVDAVKNIRSDIGIIVTDNPRRFLLKLNNQIESKQFKSIIANSANISKKAIISDKNVYIGENVTIEDNVVIKENTIIRDDVLIGAGTVLSGNSLMIYKDNEQNSNIVSEHNGFLYIDSNTKIFYNNTIDKAIFLGDLTYIGKNSLIESNVTIAHGSKLSEGVAVISNSKICGYTNIGDRTYIGPGSIISNNLNIGKDCNIRIGSVVVENLQDNADVSAPFALNHKSNLMHRFNIISRFGNKEDKNDYNRIR